MRPDNNPVSSLELLARNVYRTSQYGNKSGLKRNYLYPNYTKESRYYPGKHSCRISVQRLCYGGWNGIIEMADKTKHESQTLVGFGVAKAFVPERYGFMLEPADHDKNLYHAHIYIPELDLPFPDENIEKVMDSGLRRRLDCMREDFEFLSLDDLIGESSDLLKPDCNACLSQEKDN